MYSQKRTKKGMLGKVGLYRRLMQSMVQTIKYEVIKKLDNVEIRRYPKIVVAKVSNFSRTVLFFFSVS